VFAIQLFFSTKNWRFRRSFFLQTICIFAIQFFQQKIGVFAVQFFCKKLLFHHSIIFFYKRLAFLPFFFYAKNFAFSPFNYFLQKNWRFRRSIFFAKKFNKKLAFSPFNFFTTKIGVVAVQLILTTKNWRWNMHRTHDIIGSLTYTSKAQTILTAAVYSRVTRLAFIDKFIYMKTNCP
jgi:hypothetical protein